MRTQKASPEIYEERVYLEDKILQLVEQVETRPACFYQRLDDDGRQFLDACLQARRDGKQVSPQRISDVLGTEFKTQTSETAVRRHLKGACRCGGGAR